MSEKQRAFGKAMKAARRRADTPGKVSKKRVHAWAQFVKTAIADEDKSHERTR